VRAYLPIAVTLLLSAGCQKAPAQSTNSTPAGAGATSQAAAVPAAGATQAPAPSAPTGQPGVPPVAGAPGAAPQSQSPAVKPVPAQLPEVLARVNGEAISRAEFERALKNIEGRAGRQVPSEQRDAVYRGVLDQLVTFHVLQQEVKARNIAVSDADLDARLAEVKKQFPSEDEFKKALGSRGMSLDDLRKETRSELAVSKMVESVVAPQIKIEESEVKDFYDKNPDQFQQPESYRASHILIRVDAGAPDAQKKEARAKAEGLLTQVQAGGDFAQLAKDNSQDGSASNGGDLNYFRKGQMVEPFQKAVEALKVGEVSGVVETQFGYHIIKLTDRKPARTVTLAEAGPRIGQFLTMRAQQQKAGEFLQQLRSKSKIEILI